MKVINRWRRARAAAAVVVVIACSTACALHSVPETPRDQFQRAVQEYLELRQQAVKRLGSVSVVRDPGTLNDSTEELAKLLQSARYGLEQGVFFSFSLSAGLRDALAERLARRDGATLAPAVQEAQPSGVTPAINAIYPADQPGTSMPPSLLSVLPEIPSLLAYRFVGRNLLLLDRNTGLVLDALPAALPELGRR